MGLNQFPAASTAVSPYVPTLIPNTPPTGFTLRTTISTAGAGTWTHPGGSLAYIWVLCIGGGGAGGGGTGTVLNGGGGGGGGVAMGLLAVSGNQTYYVGEGGITRNNDYSYAGSATSFGNTGSSGGTIVAAAGGTSWSFTSPGGSTVNGAQTHWQTKGVGGGAPGNFGILQPASVDKTTFGGGSNIADYGNSSGFGYAGGGGIVGGATSYMNNNSSTGKSNGGSGLYTGGGGGGGNTANGMTGGSSVLGGYSGGAGASGSPYAGGGGAGYLANGSAGVTSTGGAGGAGGGGGGSGGGVLSSGCRGGAGGVGCIQIWY